MGVAGIAGVTKIIIRNRYKKRTEKLNGDIYL